MNLSISQPSLREALASVSRAVSPKSTLPVLANVLLKATSDKLQVSATNLSIGISKWIDATVTETGEITVPARTLTDLVNALPASMVHLTVNPATMTLTVKCGTNKTNIKGIDAAEFPPMPERGEALDLDAAAFIQAVNRTVFSASTEEARPVLQCVHLTGAVLASTDGFRVSVCKLDREIAKSALVPAPALSTAAKMAGDGKLAVRFPPGGTQVIFQGDGWLLVSQLADGSFPDYKVILPKSFKTSTTVTVSDLTRACRQAEIIARGGNNVVRLKIEQDQIEVSGISEETGDAEVRVDANTDGPDQQIAFNVSYLLQALGVVGSENVILQTNDHKTPAMITIPGDENFTHVIMPMYLG